MEYSAEYEERRRLVSCVEYGVKKALQSLGLITAEVSKAEAYRLHGRRSVDKWLRQGVLKPNYTGPNSSKVKLNRMDMEKLSLTDYSRYLMGLEENQ